VVHAPSGVVIIDDTFNSNPAGASVALAALRGIEVTGRRVVVTPGMIEMGARQAIENEEFAREAATVADVVIVVGRTNRASLMRGLAGVSGLVVIELPTRDKAVDWVRASLREGDAVLYENDLPDNYP
jgi:UDP-N-acetylmuramoyl-tripeptide--D-alanyl-D-alanine ligase